jgi:hypothetical protein
MEVEHNQAGQLQSLAFSKGYRIQRALIRNCWRLIDEKTGEPAVTDWGGTAFTVKAAMKYLAAKPDR